jgi:hypothetical protein
MYFDAVLVEGYKPIFNGTPEETKKWLETHKDDVDVQKAEVCLGRTLTYTSIENYLKNA